MRGLTHGGSIRAETKHVKYNMCSNCSDLGEGDLKQAAKLGEGGQAGGDGVL